MEDDILNTHDIEQLCADIKKTQDIRYIEFHLISGESLSYSRYNNNTHKMDKNIELFDTMLIYGNDTLVIMKNDITKFIDISQIDRITTRHFKEDE